jgi:fluoride exporter
MRELLAVAAGGSIGATLRWILAGAIQRATGGTFPWGTFAVNAAGSFAIGFLYIYLIERSTFGELPRLLITVGILGALTTFSTYSLESIRLMEQGDFGLALANVLGQVVVCLILTWLGIQLARFI